MAPAAGGTPASRGSRAAYLRFVREHHPDAGGDPEEFIAGMRRFESSGDPRPRGDDAPIVFVTRPRGLPGLLAALRRQLRSQVRRRLRPRSRRGAPRVR